MQLADKIEQTLLKPEATVKDIMKLCDDAKRYNFYAVCVQPCYVRLAKHLLSGSTVKVVTVVGFPLGLNMSAVKAYEAKLAVEAHADEIDMVMNVAAFKTGDYVAVTNDIKAVVEAAKPAPVKVIVEACRLTEREKRSVARLIYEGGAAYIKTSTGFSEGGATIEDVQLFKLEAEKYNLKVKAAGGIRDKATAVAMVAAGADRIGTSAGVAIVDGDRLL